MLSWSQPLQKINLLTVTLDMSISEAQRLATRSGMTGVLQGYSL